MLEFLVDNLSTCAFVAVLLVALCPGIESKIAIPFALSVQVWGSAVLSPWLAFLIAFVGSIIPIPIVFWVTRKIKNKTVGFIQEKYIEKIKSKYKKNFDRLGNKTSLFQKCFFLGTFVAIPLPMTGVYTGSIISGLTNMKFWHCFLSIVLGELVSCSVVLLLCLLFENSAFYILIASLIILVVFVLFNIILSIINKIKSHRVLEINDKPID